MVLRFLLWAFAWSATFSWVQASDPVHVGTFTCPLPSEPPLVIDTSHLSHTETSRIILQLAVGAPHTLCTLVEQAPPARPNTNHLLKPYGRSYDHHAWEAYANHWASFECSSSSCTVELPLPPTTEHVYLLSTSERTLSPTNFAARFLEKTTFGPTLAEIVAFDTPQAYVQEQLELSSTVTSLRQFWRARIGHWHTTTGGHGQLAAHPCRATARYRSYAFIDLDERRIVTIAHHHAEVVLSVDGLARTVVPNVTLRDTGDELPDGSYEICGVEEGIGSRLRFRLEDRSCVDVVFGNSLGGNPPVAFDETNLPTGPIIDLDDSLIQPVMEGVLPNSQIIQLMAPVANETNCHLAAKTTGIPEQVVVGLYNNSYYIHSPYFDFQQNDLIQPLADGGKSTVEATAQAEDPQHHACCSNVPRNFINEGSCRISTDACINSDPSSTNVELTLTTETLKTIYEVTGGSEGDSTRYVFAITNLRQTLQHDNPPCTPGARSRFVRVESLDPSCTGGTPILSATRQIFSDLLSEMIEEDDSWIQDIEFPTCGLACPSQDEAAFGFRVKLQGGVCFENTHADNFQVFDFSDWARDHPGGPFSIQKFANRDFLLEFPESHGMASWNQYKASLTNVGRLDDRTTLLDLPEALFREEILHAFGGENELLARRGPTLICGSPYEVSNTKDVSFGLRNKAGFDLRTYTNNTAVLDTMFIEQRLTVWMEVALEATDQLRLKTAWALSQIFALAPSSIQRDELSEPFLVFYDSFVRNAFGSYFDLMKEMTYSPLMAEHLTYRDGRSTAYEYTKFQKNSMPDENMAREMMQLFTTGLYMLEPDGKSRLNSHGQKIRTYSNEDIAEYAKVFTGFTRQKTRGNVEDRTRQPSAENPIDPMTINVEWRCPFPKLGLLNKYIGDGYPLCSDLPPKHFLLAGATYRFLGTRPFAELHRNADFSGAAPIRLTLKEDSALFQVLCNHDSQTNSPCRHLSKVVLPQNIACTASSIECLVEDISIVKVGMIYYEYVRPPCVHHAFFQNALAIRTRWGKEKFMCGNPLDTSSSAICCDSSKSRKGAELYSGEKVTFLTAQERCTAQEKDVCEDAGPVDCDDISVGGCDTYHGFYWTRSACILKAKINSDGQVAIIHDLSSVGSTEVRKVVDSDTVMFFRVHKVGADWDPFLADFAPYCSSMGCSISLDGHCVCDVSVENSMAFTRYPESVEEVLSVATIGAFPPAQTDKGSEIAGTGFVMFPDGELTMETVFVVTDDQGRKHFRKNLKSVVTAGALRFRNPVHFIQVSNPQLLDAQYEVDAALESLFYHPNTASFIGRKLAQRLGTSNPSPLYATAIANAFTTGQYTFDPSNVFGSGNYGCMKATIAAILLDRESLDAVLDMDPFSGSLIEPFLKITKLMRSLEFQSSEHAPLVRFRRDIQDFIGQEPFQLPSVFGFFDSDFSTGRLSYAGLASPESQIANGPALINMMNSIYSYLKYGLSFCFEGNGYGESDDNKCEIGRTPSSDGHSSVLKGDAWDTPQEMLSSLSTLLTSGRLSAQNAQQIVQQIEIDFAANKTIEALINAQQAVAMTPEFHATNALGLHSEQPRPTPPAPAPPELQYRVSIFVSLSGGMDSWLLLRPSSCSGTNIATDAVNPRSILDQYEELRGSLTLDSTLNLDIHVANQPCETFGIHPDIPILKTLYDSNELLFLANVGVINQQEMDKKNFSSVTKTQLFAHNAMQEEVQRLDPFQTFIGTGVFGRAKDVLTARGVNVDSMSIDISSFALDGIPGLSSPSSIVGRNGLTVYGRRPESEDLNVEDLTAYMNSARYSNSSVFGEVFSEQLTTGIRQSQELQEALASADHDSSIWGPRPGSWEREHYEKWLAVFHLIQTRIQREAERDFFYLEFGGWDHHGDLKRNFAEKIRALNYGIEKFTSQMKAAGLWEDCVIIFTSEFARTLNGNSGDGSDHGWGGHYFLMGGGVRGGRMVGEYPSDLTETSPLNIGLGRGRLIPTTSWDAVWHGVVQWMGVTSPEDMNICLPNLNNTVNKVFPPFTQGDLFTASSLRTLESKDGGGMLRGAP